MREVNDLLQFFLPVILIPLGFVILLIPLYNLIRYLHKHTAIFKAKRRTFQYKEVTIEEGNVCATEGSLLQDADEATDERLLLMSNEGPQKEESIDDDSKQIQPNRLQTSKTASSASVDQQDMSLGNDEACAVVEMFHEEKEDLTTDDEQDVNSVGLRGDEQEHKTEETGTGRCKGRGSDNGSTNEMQNWNILTTSESGKDKTSYRSVNGDMKVEGSHTYVDRGGTELTDIKEEDEEIDEEEDAEDDKEDLDEEDTDHRGEQDIMPETLISLELLKYPSKDPSLQGPSKDLSKLETRAQGNQLEDRDTSDGCPEHLNQLSPVPKEDKRANKLENTDDVFNGDLKNHDTTARDAVSANNRCTKNSEAKVLNIPTKRPLKPPRPPGKPPHLPATPPRPSRENHQTHICINSYTRSLDLNPVYPSNPSPLLLHKHDMQGRSIDSKVPPLPSSLPRDTRYKKRSQHGHTQRSAIDPPGQSTGRYGDTSFTMMMTRMQDSPEEPGNKEQGHPPEASLPPQPPQKPKRKPAKLLRSSPPHVPPPPPPTLKSPSSPPPHPPPTPMSPSSSPTHRSIPPLPPTKPHSLPSAVSSTSDEYENAACAPPPSSRTSPRKGSMKVVKPTFPPPRPPVQSTKHVFFATRDDANCLPTTTSKMSSLDESIIDEQSSCKKYPHKKLVRQGAVVLNPDNDLSSKVNFRKFDFGSVEEEFVNPIYGSSVKLASPSMHTCTTKRQFDASLAQQPASSPSSSQYNGMYITAVPTAYKSQS